MNGTGCKKGHYNNPKTLSMRNEMAYQHFRKCKLQGQWPDDLSLERGVLLNQLEEMYRDERHQLVQLQFLQSVTAVGAMR